MDELYTGYFPAEWRLETQLRTTEVILYRVYGGVKWFLITLLLSVILCVCISGYSIDSSLVIRDTTK